MQRKGHFELDAIMPLIGREKRIELCGERVKVRSKRLLNFKVNGIRCVKCGVEGEYFALNRVTQSERWHLNLYGVTEEGREVIMTRDHIHPKSKNGSDDLDNSQTMCAPCNNRKGNRLVGGGREREAA